MVISFNLKAFIIGLAARFLFIIHYLSVLVINVECSMINVTPPAAPYHTTTAIFGSVEADKTCL